MRVRICRTCGGPMDAESARENLHSCAGCWAVFEAERDEVLQRTAGNSHVDPIATHSGGAACADVVEPAGAGFFTEEQARAKDGPSPFIVGCAVEYARLMALEGAA